MEDEPAGTPQEQPATSETPQAPPPSLPHAEGAKIQKEDPQQGTKESSLQPEPELQPKPGRLRRFRTWLRGSEGSAWVMVFLTFVIAATGVVGIVLVIQGGQDTAIMIKAATQQAYAARHFADTAEKINGNINDAVSKLNIQAVKTGKLADEALAQANATRSLAQTSIDALVSVQRAFVFATNFDGIRIQDPNDPTKISSVDFSVTWENSGTTPTRDMRSHFSWLTPQIALPDDFPYPDLGDQRATPIALGPKAIGHTTPISISAADISKIMNHQELLYVWGWARYRDVFPKTRSHITKFCTEVTGFEGNPLLVEAGAISRPITQNCPNYNCYDDECKVL